MERRFRERQRRDDTFTTFTLIGGDGFTNAEADACMEVVRAWCCDQYDDGKYDFRRIRVMGWSVRFLHKIDAMVFKMRWC
ncbi:MAG: hypothetical protein EOP83_02785 [Verrucomicrobiaceae bacterium]|nr:MAG: hypothetical protein EOP83_02785 [Verrucomicrobiaceae bacterium]